MSERQDQQAEADRTRTDHDDTPSTAERERALRDLHSEGWRENDITAPLTWPHIQQRVRANRLAARCAAAEAELADFHEACRQYGVDQNAGPDGVGKLQRRREHWESEATKEQEQRVRLTSDLLNRDRENERLRAELAKLRAAAAPVELPLDRVLVLLVPDGWTRDDFYAALHPPGGGCVPMFIDAAGASALRALLALPPQEDVRGAIAKSFEAEAVQLEANVAGCSSGTQLLARSECRRLREIAERIRTWPTAPRTEGGGDHGE